MASAFDSNIGTELITTGEQSGIWGVTVNNNYTNVFGQAIYGSGTLQLTADANTTFNVPQNSGATNGIRAANLVLTSSLPLTATRTVTLASPSGAGIQKLYSVYNNTTGGQSIVLRTTGGGAGVTVPTGKRMLIILDGTDAIEQFNQVGTLAVNSSLILPSGFAALSQRGAEIFGTTGNTANNQTLTLSPAPGLTTGMIVNVLIGGGLTPTSQWTLNVNGTGALGTYSPQGFRLNAGSVKAGRSYPFIYTGSVWQMIGAPGPHLLWEQSASNSAQINFTSLDGSYDEYEAHWIGVIPSTVDQGVAMRISQAGSFISTGTYAYTYNLTATSANTPSSTLTGTSFALSAGIASSGSYVGNGSVRIAQISGASSRKTIMWHAASTDSAGNRINVVGMGSQDSNPAVDGLQFLMGSGNVASGVFRLYGIPS